MPSDTAGTQPALAALPLPKYDTLTPDQARGATCVWDGTRLTGETAVDLGPRRDDDGVWFPRACRPCAQKQAMDALVEHSSECEQCVDDHNLCPEGSTLVRAVREARR
ncbi:hypothetical protein [Streptomyces sp. SCL15-4]|uniref:hypothetical protein n=1 Tax=Streptomyces sp. SCL15-4 TaxID=2967221 RepID=UPI0029669BEE|nr:hypothetical protein [Streptomyces sp. SCL15-4]